jgi:beta-lactamase regulating signal transducer with metallopeptidase domain
MNPDLLLGVATAVVGFALKSTLAFAVCLALSWLADSPGRKFIVWLSFLYGTAAYWLWLAKGLMPKEQLSAGISATPIPLAQPVSPTVGAFQIPGTWASPLGLGLRAMGIVYLLVLGYLLVSEIKKVRQLKWILGFTSQPPGEIVETFQPLAESLGVGRSRLLVLSGATSPATFGWIRPTIVLPEVCLEQDRSELEDVLRHELHHVRRWDFVWNGLAVLCRALLFFHPAAWYAVRRMQFDRELACDLAAVSDSPKGRAKYAECLIHFARLNSSQQAKNWGIDFAASSEHLKTRVRSILAGSKKRSLWLVWSRIACGACVLAGFLSVEPSLGFLLTYAQKQITQPFAAAVNSSPGKTQPRLRAGRKGRSSTPPAPASVDSAVASLSETTQPTDFSGQISMDASAPAPSSAGPQLLHRGSAPSARRATQTAVPIDDPSGQAAKGGDHDSKQALQQTATAVAGIYKRIGDLDRH